MKSASAIQIFSNSKTGLNFTKIFDNLERSWSRLIKLSVAQSSFRATIKHGNNIRAIFYSPLLLTQQCSRWSVLNFNVLLLCPPWLKGQKVKAHSAKAMYTTRKVIWFRLFLVTKQNSTFQCCMHNMEDRSFYQKNGGGQNFHKFNAALTSRNLVPQYLVQISNIYLQE